MSRVSDEEVARIYDIFKEYAERHLRSNDNPNLGLCAFNEMPEPSLLHIIIPITGVNRVDYREMDRALAGFPEGGASLHQEEGEDGKPKYWVYIPIPQKKKKKYKSPRHKGVSYALDHRQPSCTQMLLYVIGFLIIGMFAALYTTKGDWSFAVEK